MEPTTTGYKVTLGAFDTVTDMRENGVWHGMTGQTFWEWLQDAAVSTFHGLLEFADVALLVAVVLVFLSMFGSKRAGKWLYWTVAGYVILKLLGVAI